MPIYSVPKAGAVGYIDSVDMRPYEMPDGAWSFVRNARMIDGKVEAVTGWELLAGIGDTTASALDFYNSPIGAQHIYVYTDNDILSVNATGTVNNVGKVGLQINPYPDDVWVVDQLNSIPVSTNNRDAPQCFYNPGGTVNELTISQDFPNWPTDVTCKVVVAYKNFLVALNIVDVEAYPNMVWWSDAADPGEMPSSWDYTATDNLAGRTVLGAEAGSILGAAVLRDSLFIYTEYSTYRMDFIGGQFVMRFTKVFQNSGTFGPRCIAKFGERHLVITKSDVIIHDGQQMQSIADMRVRNRIIQSVDETDFNRLWTATYLSKSEVWLGIPDVSQGKEFPTVVVWQWDEGAFSVRDVPFSRIMRELPILDTTSVDDSWDGGSDTTWDGGQDIIWNSSGTVGDLQPVVTSTDGELNVMDRGEQTQSTWLFRSGIALGGDNSTRMARAVYPKLSGESDVTIILGYQDAVDGPVNWQASHKFTPKEDYEIKSRANGRRHAIWFLGKGFKLEGFDIEYTEVGRR